MRKNWDWLKILVVRFCPYFRCKSLCLFSFINHHFCASFLSFTGGQRSNQGSNQKQKNKIPLEASNTRQQRIRLTLDLNCKQFSSVEGFWEQPKKFQMYNLMETRWTTKIKKIEFLKISQYKKPLFRILRLNSTNYKEHILFLLIPLSHPWVFYYGLWIVKFRDYHFLIHIVSKHLTKD